MSQNNIVFFAPSKRIKQLPTVQGPGRKFDDKLLKFAFDSSLRDNGCVIVTYKQRKGNFP